MDDGRRRLSSEKEREKECKVLFCHLNLSDEWKKRKADVMKPRYAVRRVFGHFDPLPVGRQWLKGR